MSPAGTESGQEHKLLAKVFHLISQPMTALQCSLEFALNTLDDATQCRSWIEAALENSERLRCRLSLAREIAEGQNAEDAIATVELRSVLEEALSEAEPFFPQRAGLRLQCDEIAVSGERSRLLRAFLYILQHLDPAETAAPCNPEISVSCEAQFVEVRFSRFVLRRTANKDQVASQLEIAKEIFESAGGGMVFFCFAGNDAMVRVFLPTSQAQLDLYDEADRKKPAATTIGRTALFPQVS